MMLLKHLSKINIYFKRILRICCSDSNQFRWLSSCHLFAIYKDEKSVLIILEILHIDTTFSTNVEKFQLVIFLVLDANLHGVPVAYSFINSETNSNLEYVYHNFAENNPYQQIKVIIVDKN